MRRPRPFCFGLPCGILEFSEALDEADKAIAVCGWDARAPFLSIHYTEMKMPQAHRDERNTPHSRVRQISASTRMSGLFLSSLY